MLSLLYIGVLFFNEKAQLTQTWAPLSLRCVLRLQQAAAQPTMPRLGADLEDRTSPVCEDVRIHEPMVALAAEQPHSEYLRVLRDDSGVFKSAGRPRTQLKTHSDLLSEIGQLL
jgi:hypothetical protein